MRLTILFLFMAFSAFGQKKSIENITATRDNYQLYYNSKKQDKVAVDNLIVLCLQYRSVSKDTTRLLGEKALEWSKKLDKSLYAKALLQIGDTYGFFGDYDEAVKMIGESKAIYDALKDAENATKCDNQIGSLAINKGNFEVALNSFLKVVSENKKHPEGKQSVEPYLNLGWIYFNLNNLTKCQEYLKQAGALAKKLDDDASWMLVSEKQAILLMYIGERYLKQARADSIQRKQFQDSSDIFINQSFEAFRRSLKFSKKLGDKATEVSILNNMTVLNLKLNRIEDGLKTAKQAETLATSLEDTPLLVQSKYNLIYVYMALKRYDLAKKYGEEALQLANRYDLKRKKALINAALYELYSTTGDYKKALQNFEARYAYEEEIGNTERNKVLAEVEAKFQNEKKQKEILQLKNKNKKITRQRNFTIISVLLIALFGFIMFQFFKIQRERNDKMAFTKALIFAQEAERKRIARDLHDGIGQSLLLMKKQLISTHTVTVENQKMITDTLEEVRSISKDLHPLQLEKFGLTTAIEDMIAKVEKSTDLFVTTEIENIDANFTSKTDIHVFRAIQEALNNIVKHANATAAKVIIENKEKETLITILDNGQGFDHELAIAKSKSLGLKTMYERLASIDGKMKIMKNEPSGTKVEFKILKG
jgi:signal transduction histidine kinase